MSQFTQTRVSFGQGWGDQAQRVELSMEQRKTIWRGGEDRQLWLTMLLDAMEEAARPEVRAKPCPPAVLRGLRAQLAQPVSHYPFEASAFSRRH